MLPLRDGAVAWPAAGGVLFMGARAGSALHGCPPDLACVQPSKPEADALERAGFPVALDAPAGVGASMPDRLGLMVSSTGAAAIQLNNNDTGVPVRLVTDAEGGGGVELIEFDRAEKKARIRRITYGDDSRREVSIGD